ncbi:hypothetical protein [Stenotrophomonas sp.]|uniref:hypothetical protein n=1 Tax=Stenotrophomonas sp. TaxID=69392 RepID=UPI002FC8B40F
MTHVGKLGLSLATTLLSPPLAVITGQWFFLLLCLLSLPTSILYWMDVGRALRNGDVPGRARRLAGLLMGLPQALFGLLSAGMGLSLIGWVLYNSLVERQPSYSGGFLTWGLGPALTWIGVHWALSAFRRDRPADSPS